MRVQLARHVPRVPAAFALLLCAALLVTPLAVHGWVLRSPGQTQHVHLGAHAAIVAHSPAVLASKHNVSSIDLVGDARPQVSSLEPQAPIALHDQDLGACAEPRSRHARSPPAETRT